ncbi:prepilin-type N-terminal cleavage/methylation domain-containing protein [Candidatus Dependentiae bacterium]|nr:prepilin-type N-terminal cleavage/methylation domain-containing protein [Candidatus Dependentiae bacterium]
MNKGYTLIELLIVLVLFVLITTLSITNFGFLHRSITRAELYHLYSLCYYLQHKAMATRQEQKLYIDISHNTYTYDNTTYQLPQSVSFGYLSGVKGPPTAPKKILSKPVTFKNDTVEFYPDGIISSGSIYIRDAYNNSLHALTNGIAHVSFIRLYIYNKTWRLVV